jgi:hypothetical protein
VQRGCTYVGGGTGRAGERDAGFSLASRRRADGRRDIPVPKGLHHLNELIKDKSKTES